MEALNDFRQGGPPIYLIIYRPQPHHAFSAWARVRDFSAQPSGRADDPKDIRWTLTLDQHEFPRPLGLKSNARSLMDQVSWLKQGLQMAFQGYAVRQITAQDAQIILDAARQQPEHYLPHAWDRLAPVRDFAQALEQRTYTAAELHAAAGELAADLTAEEFTDRLRWLRVLRRTGEDYYTIPGYVRGDPGTLLRIMALALLLFGFHSAAPSQAGTATYSLSPNARAAQFIQPDIQLQLWRMQPAAEGDGQSPQRALRAILDHAHDWLKRRVEVACHGVFLDTLSANAIGELADITGITTRTGASFNTTLDDLLVCPKPHVVAG